MRSIVRIALLAALSLSLGGCFLVYKLPTRQGNVIQQTELDQLQTEMTKAQVEYLLGTPIANSPFDKNRWDYLGYYRVPHGKTAQREISLFFDDQGKLVRMKGVHDSDESLAPSPTTPSEVENRSRSGGAASGTPAGGPSPGPTAPTQQPPGSMAP